MFDSRCFDAEGRGETERPAMSRSIRLASRVGRFEELSRQPFRVRCDDVVRRRRRLRWARLFRLGAHVRPFASMRRPRGLPESCETTCDASMLPAVCVRADLYTELFQRPCSRSSRHSLFITSLTPHARMRSTPLHLTQDHRRRRRAHTRSRFLCSSSWSRYPMWERG